MSTRRERERADVRARIVAAALNVLEAEGSAALTVRRVAAEVEYTAPVVYQHFDGKDGLILVLVEQGYRRLRGEMAAAIDAPGPAGERILRGADAYLRFAGEHPHLYQAMNNTLLDPAARQRSATPVTELVYGLLAGWAAENETPLDLGEGCEMLWGTLHGMASLGHLGTIGPDRARHLGDRAVRAILTAWRG
ncbi:TetR/AcrR family transcriptional regulator [Catenuloplanes atrovinosus]|uniref:AcrR family transcriptional regulator n=1 Tax=Catenuloplanes atrovinosus TaxID=137266 RepID=A0AAE4CA98_9ACTN|nr:TetR/AcrR family transcriptional regulator [Catenuloplanes atrovinosus]MDR7276687.1 AcrR family transcriptional regulator [Catenuloplanes atrovinosus]